MATFREHLKPWVRAVGNRVRFPRSRIGISTFLSRGTRVAAGAILGKQCRIFDAKLGPATRLGDNVIVGHGARIGHSSVGSDCLLEAKTRVHGCTLAPHVSIQTRSILNEVRLGRFSYVGREAYLNDVTLGGFCSVGPRVLLGCGDHPADLPSTSPVFFSTRGQCGATFAAADHAVERRPITLGHDVWIGAHAFVRDGVTIGDGAIVAAGAVVTADVPPYAIVGGIPARVIRLRFPDAAITQLLALQWWHWDEPRLRAAQPWFILSDINAFLRRVTA